MGSGITHRVRRNHFDDPPSVGVGALAVLALHAAAAVVLLILVYVLNVIEDTTAVIIAGCGGLTQLVYIVPLLVMRRAQKWRRFRVGVVIVASITFMVSVVLVLAVMSLNEHYRG